MSKTLSGLKIEKWIYFCLFIYNVCSNVHVLISLFTMTLTLFIFVFNRWSTLSHTSPIESFGLVIFISIIQENLIVPGCLCIFADTVRSYKHN